jgi:hypothetical protein
MSALNFTTEVIELYLREDLKELDNPMRQDHGILMQDLRYLFRAYGQKYKSKPDWSPAKTPGRSAPEGAMNINGGN